MQFVLVLLLVLAFSYSTLCEDLSNDEPSHHGLTRLAEDGVEVHESQMDERALVDNSDKADRIGLWTSYDSCGQYTNCSSCYETSTCHWCAQDETCHLQGSIYGCFYGASCGNDDDDKPPPDSCSAYDTCSKCGETYTCHWCASDNQCHTIGSIYGCVVGVDCYSNERCRREEPEPLPPPGTFDVGLIAQVSIIFITGLCFFCVTMCTCCVRDVKGAYDDLAATAARVTEADLVVAQPAPAVLHVVPSEAPLESSDDENQAKPQKETASVETNDVKGSRQNASDPSTEIEAFSSSDDRFVCQALDDQDPLAERVPFLPPPTLPAHRRGLKHVRRMHCVCMSLYLFAIVVMGFSVYGAFYYFPRMPEYSVCNDEVAWKSLVDSMTSLTVTADFEILMSFSNPNNFDIALDMGRGSFYHHGASVGTFTVPPVQAPASAITDLMIIAAFSPEKWDALSLTAEYYSGNLLLTLDAEFVIRVPLLANYSTEIRIDHEVVNVNEEPDLRWCKCNKWNDGTSLAS